MSLQRLNFRTFDDEILRDPTSSQKIFWPSGKAKPDPTAQEEPTPPPPPVFSEEELKAAERDGYKKGFIDGVQEGQNQAKCEQTEIDLNLTATLEKFSDMVSPLFNDYSQIVLQVRENTPKLALAIAKKVAGVALDKNSESIISDIAAKCCEEMVYEAKLAITIHESMADTLEAKLKQLATRLPASAQIIIIRDPNMPKTDCRVEWERGSLEREVAHLWQQVEMTIDNMVATSMRDTKQQLDILQDTLPRADENKTIEKE